MKQNNLALAVIIIWVLITLLRLAFHQPWYDEAHAYMLAQNLTLPELIAEMKYEGHLFVWYILILPFAKLDLWYPYPMQIINWICAFVAVLVLWKKAPFHPITKSVITFSYPFITEMPVIARCYSVGIMLLIVMASLYHKSLKHPILYAILILFCANTSVMALFGATVFGFVFAYDLIKGALSGAVSKKDFRISFSVLALCAVLILWQISGSISFSVVTKGSFFNNFSAFIYGDYNSGLKILFDIIICVFVTYTTVIFWDKSKKLFISATAIYSLMLFCFIFKYPGWSHHFVFFWIYALVLYWILLKDISKRKLIIISEVILSLFFLILVFSKEPQAAPLVYNSKAKTMATIVHNNIGTSQKARVIVTGTEQERIVPYLKKFDNIEIYSYSKAENIKNCRLWEDIPTYQQLEKDLYIVKASWLTKSLAEDRINYIIMPESINNSGGYINDGTTKYLLKYVINLPYHISLYRIVKD